MTLSSFVEVPSGLSMTDEVDANGREHGKSLLCPLCGGRTLNQPFLSFDAYFWRNFVTLGETT